jgi:N-acetylneuraminic acid mutarotase
MGASSIGNSQPNTWSLMYVKMPLKLAKLAAVALDKSTILICGGIYGQSEEGFGE